MSKLSKRCHEYAIPSLCYHAFPLCDDKDGQQRPRKICKEECEFLENNVCREDYIRAKEYPLIGKGTLSNLKFYPWPDS